MRPALLTLLLAAACTEEPPPPPDNAPPLEAEVAPPPPRQAAAPPTEVDKPPRVKAVTLDPPRFNSLEDVGVKVDATDPEGGLVDLDYRWFRNDRELLHRRGDVLPASELHKGDEIKVIVTISDGTNEEEREAGPVTVMNANPEFVTDLEKLGNLDGAVIEARDPDEDPLTHKLAGQPPGMSIDPKSGKLSYKGSKDAAGGAYQVSIIAEDPDGGSVTWKFGIEVSGGSGAPK